jgi:hypothetical protein
MKPMGARLRGALALLVGLAASAMLLLGFAFYTRSVAGVASEATRHFVLAATGAAILPFAWMLFNLVLRRVPIALLAAITCALAYLVGAGWFAVLLALFSWGDPTLWLPAAGLPVQLVALLAASWAWRGLPLEARRSASGLQGIAVPLTLAAASALLAAAFYRDALRLPDQRKWRQAAAEQAIAAAQRCLIEYGREHGGDHPARLDETGGASEACREAAGARERLAGYAFAYWPGPPDSNGRRARFSLCAWPEHPPDSGLVTLVADDSGVLGSAIAPDPGTVAVACGPVWGALSGGFVKQIQQCALAYAVRDGSPGYPATLEDLVELSPECVGPADRVRLQGRHAVFAERFDGKGVFLRYLASPTSPDGRVLGYRLYADCVGGDGHAVIDQDGLMLHTDVSQTQALLNGCVPDSSADLEQLARASGFRLAPSLQGIPANPWAAANAADPVFGDQPDLPARRAECERETGACYALGRELERAVRLAGGEPDREESQDASQRALVWEADLAYARDCENGHAKSCAAYASALFTGRGSAPDRGQALALYARACTAGLASACMSLSDVYANGHQPMRPAQSSLAVTPWSETQPIEIQVPDASQPSIAKDVEQAIAWSRKACERGDETGCAHTAQLLLESADAGGEARRREAIDTFQRLCDRGRAFACSKLAAIAPAAGQPIEGRSADEWRRMGCVLGDAEACGP